MDWHTRFTQQARWTTELRRYLFTRTELDRVERILEVGCGTGAVLATLSPTKARCFGLDINDTYLKQAARHAPGVTLVQGDAHQLPFASAQFDCVFYHFTLLWITDPLAVLGEAQRLVHPGGWVMALAEPDYGGRIDYPDDLVETGRLQAESLRRLGADIHLGRQLGALFHLSGLQNIETGVLSGQWREPPSQVDLDLEWAVLEADLRGMLSIQELSRLRLIDRQAWQSGERLLFVPTFYAIGQAFIK